MIVIRVWGGIGNQLFQYSFGEYLRLKTQQEVKYDIGSYGRTDKFRQFELKILNPNIPTVENIKLSQYRGIKNKILCFLFNLKAKNRFIEETDFSEDLLLPVYPDGIVYLQGYWGNKLYPNEVIKHNLCLFTPYIEKPIEIHSIENEIKKEKQAVALHIRRGDYFTSKKNIKKYGICNPDYYHRAINYLNQKWNNSRIFVFSDDLEWVRDNINLSENTFFVPNYDINNFWFIFLMSKCKHNIISNSSFSWWGAYLNSNIDKIVIIPIKWIDDSNNTLFLSDWLRM